MLETVQIVKKKLQTPILMIGLITKGMVAPSAVRAVNRQRALPLLPGLRFHLAEIWRN
jgi:hypothetical protein